MVVRFHFLAVLLLIPCLTAGCGRSADRPPATISGIVSLDGEPLKSGSIQLTSMKTGEAAYTNLDEAGKYRLEFPEADVGAEYQVTIGQPVTDSPDALAAPVSTAKNNVPAKFANRATSGLTAQLQAGENTQNFDLKSN